MSGTDPITELQSLRQQVSELTRALLEQASPPQSHHPDETLEDLREESRLLRAIIEGTAADTGDEFFASLVQHLTKVLNVRYALIGELADGASAMMRTLAMSDRGTLIDNFTYDLAHAPCGTGLRQTFWCFEQGVQAQFPQFSTLAALGVESHCGVSIRDKAGAVTGMMIVMDTKPLTRSDRLKSLMEIFAARAAGELHRHKAELARHQMEQSLRDSEARTRSIIEGAMDGVVSIDRKGRIIGWNSEAETIFGYAAHEVMGEPLSDTIIPCQHRAAHEAGIERILACPAGLPVKRRLELHALHRDGHEFPVEFTIAMTQVSGEPVLSAFIRDISAQTRAAEALHRTAETLRAVVQSAPVAIVTCNAQGLQTSWNPAAERIFGWTEEDMLGQPLLAMSQDHEAATAPLWRHIVERRTINSMELRRQRKNGAPVDIHLWAGALLDAAGTMTGALAVMADVTEQKRDAEALAQRERQFRTVLHALPIGVWFTDRHGQVLLANPAARELWTGTEGIGIGPDVKNPDRADAASPAAEPHRWMLSEVLAGRKAASENIFELTCGDGTRRMVRNSAVPVRSDDGVIQGAVLLNEDITERVRAEEGRARTQAFLESIIDNIPHMITVTDAHDLRFLMVNRAAGRLFERTREQLIGSSVFDVLPECEATQLFGCTLNQDRTDALALSEQVVHSRSGERRVLRTKTLPIVTSVNGPQHLLTISEDVTAQTQADTLERQRVAQLIRFQSAQLRFSKLAHRDLDTDFRLIAEATAEALSVARVGIWLYKADRSAIACRHLYTIIDKKHHQPGTVLEASNFPQYFTALESALIVAAHDSRIDPRIQEFARHLEDCHITSRLDVPIRQGGRLIGVISQEHVGPARDWSPEEEAFAISVADHAALCLASAERRRMEAALRVSEERFAKAFRSSPHPVIIADLETGVIIEANDTAYLLSGYEPKDVEGRTAVDIGLWASPDDRARYMNELRRHGSVRNFEAVLRMKTGALRQCLLSSEMIDLNGRRCMVTVGTDITERKEAEEALRQSEARFRTMAEAIPQQVWTATPDGNLDYVNERCLEYFLTTADALIGSNWQRMIHPEDLPLCLERWAAARATGQPYQVDFRLRRASDQTFRWHIARALPLQDAEGRIIKWVGTNTDVTDVKQAEEALLAREQDLRHAMEERERLSQDLHDGILQSLYAVGLGLEACKPLIGAHPHEQALTAMEQAIAQLNQVMAEVRNFIAGLESEALQEGTFETALRTVIHTVTQTHPIDCRIHIEQEALGYIPLDRALQLLNIMREALSNVVRHARASHISVSVRRLRRTIRVRIHDNGVGFDPVTAAGTGHGLQNMAARAKKMRMEFELHSAIGDGTTIILDLPKEEVYVSR
ncbi:MAG: PAS domain S-box protein [Nitrospiraceae bacterium]|nr:PAS domain S-box protein [Nitrospiraceae bacterium]